MSGRAASNAVIPGRCAISVGDPGTALADGWIRAVLTSVADLGTGHTPSRKHPEYWGGDIPWIGIRDAGAHHGKVIHDTLQRINQLGLDNSSARLLPKDTVCLSRTASVGYVVKMGRDMATSQDFVTWTCTEALDPDFLLQALLAEGSDIRRFGEGSTHTTIYFPEVKAFHIALPPLPEQRRIVAKIDSLTGKSGRARNHLDHIPRLIEKYKQAVLAAAFRGDLTREWRRDQSRHSAVLSRDGSQIKPKYAEAGDFVPPYNLPGSWRWLRLPQLGDLDRGKSRHRPRNDKRLFGGTYPFIQTGEVRQADRFLTTYVETYSEFGLAQSRLWPVGTVCITIAANIAETAILGIEACFPDSVVGFLPDADKADASYVEFFLRTAREELEAFAPATAQKNINLDTLATVRVPTAPIVEQAEIVRRIEFAFAWIDRLSSEATSARKLIDRLDQAVLAKAFRGELVPQDPADEPAAVLLERIKAERGTAQKAKQGKKARARA